MSRQIETIHTETRGGLQCLEILDEAKTFGDAGPLVFTVGKVARWKSSGLAGSCAAPAPLRASLIPVSVIPSPLLLSGFEACAHCQTRALAGHWPCESAPCDTAIHCVTRNLLRMLQPMRRAAGPAGIQRTLPTRLKGLRLLAHLYCGSGFARWSSLGHCEDGPQGKAESPIPVGWEVFGEFADHRANAGRPRCSVPWRMRTVVTVWVDQSLADAIDANRRKRSALAAVDVRLGPGT